MLTWLASLQQGTAKKSEKSMKIVTEEIYISFEQLEEFQWNFLEKCDLWYKVTKTHCFTPYLEDAFLEKSQGVKLISAFLGLKKKQTNELSGIKQTRYIW